MSQDTQPPLPDPTGPNPSLPPPPGAAPAEPPPAGSWGTGPGPTPPPRGFSGPPPIPEREVRLWSTLCHLSALAGLAIPSLGAIAGPFVVWLLKRHDHPSIDANGREALNFQLSILIYSWALGLLGILTTFILVGFVFLAVAGVVGVAGLILAAYASIKVSNGGSYQYPFTIRFL